MRGRNPSAGCGFKRDGRRLHRTPLHHISFENINAINPRGQGAEPPGVCARFLRLFMDNLARLFYDILRRH